MKKYVLKLLIKEGLQEVEQSKWSSSDNKTNAFGVYIVGGFSKGGKNKNLSRWDISDVDENTTKLRLYFKLINVGDIENLIDILEKFKEKCRIFSLDNLVCMELTINKKELGSRF